MKRVFAVTSYFIALIVPTDVAHERAAKSDIQPDHWLAEYTTELLNVLHVLAMLVELEPDQAQFLEAICEGPTLDYGG